MTYNKTYFTDNNNSTFHVANSRRKVPSFKQFNIK